MNTKLLSLVMALCLANCNSPKLPLQAASDTEGCSSDHTLPALKLDASDRRILANRSDRPTTAADFYFKLPTSYFSIVEQSPERRATFVDKASLKDHYLKAEHWFECDGGGFEVTIRLFDTIEGPLIAIQSSTYESETLLKNERAAPGELQSIVVQRPRFWRFRNDQWISVDQNILPAINKDFVLDRYHNLYKGQLKDADQQKYIWLSYDLPPSGRVIPITGRENFMDPFQTYTWKTFEFEGGRFVAK
jgi:hypothetical protein